MKKVKIIFLINILANEKNVIKLSDNNNQENLNQKPMVKSQVNVPQRRKPIRQKPVDETLLDANMKSSSSSNSSLVFVDLPTNKNPLPANDQTEPQADQQTKKFTTEINKESSVMV